MVQRLQGRKTRFKKCTVSKEFGYSIKQRSSNDRMGCRVRRTVGVELCRKMGEYSDGDNGQSDRFHTRV